MILQRNSGTNRGWQIGLLMLIALMIGGASAINPIIAVVLSFFILAALFMTRFAASLPNVALGLLGFALAGYAFGGRGFAYLGVPPLFIGEAALALGLAAIFINWTRLRHIPWLMALLCFFIIIQIMSTVPYFSEYALDTARDAAIWYYSLFAIIVAQLLVRLNKIEPVMKKYYKLIPFFIIFAPLSLVIQRAAPALIPLWPTAGVPVVYAKGGDIAVHLAGIMCFLLLGLYAKWQDKEKGMQWFRKHEWLWCLLWLGAAFTTFISRAAMLTVLISGLVTVIFRPQIRWGRLLYLATVALIFLLAINFRVGVGKGDEREISAEGFLITLQSVTGDTKTARDGTREWRLNWWDKIINYTVHGPYFWTGKGYGINLADADGFQVADDNSLRSPHNGNMNILARSGVPGFTAWVLLQLAFAIAILRAHWQARANGRHRQADIFLWIFVYWMAFMINAAFDVYLEGPQGGIWFWSVFGFGLAQLEMERRYIAEQKAQAHPNPLPFSR